ncbi:YjcZ family sporulation protein [Paenibacillus ginsengarvi]|nr:YjcZ family sporulation protein [Paenibacillus ginsengarvi]
MSGIGGVGGVGGFSCGGLFTSTAVILVLFILLVIVSRGFLY